MCDALHAISFIKCLFCASNCDRIIHLELVMDIWTLSNSPGKGILIPWSDHWITMRRRISVNNRADCIENRSFFI